MNKIDHVRAIVSGVLATAVMTMVMMLAPWFGLPEMEFSATLCAAAGGSVLAGWLAHVFIGVMLAWLYALFVHVQCLPGPPFVRGAFFALYPWVIGELLVLPFLGAPLLGGTPVSVVTSLAVHLLYGAIVGSLYDEIIVEAPPAPPPAGHPYRTPAPRPPDVRTGTGGALRSTVHEPKSMVLPATQLTATRHQLAAVRALVDEFEKSLLRTDDVQEARARLLRALTRLSVCGRDLAEAAVEQPAEAPSE